MSVLAVMTVLQHFANDLLPRLQADPQLGRCWKNRGDDGIAIEMQLLIDYLCSSAVGPMYYSGRDMRSKCVYAKMSDTWKHIK